MKRRLIALVQAALLLALSACTLPSVSSPPVESEPPAAEHTSSAPRPEFALSYNSTHPLDPLATTDSGNLSLAGLVYEGLFALDGQFEPRPVLCDTYSVNASGTVWTFSLRTDAVFSDGTPLTPKHVASSLRTARSSALYAERLSSVLGVSTGENSVTVTLSAPNGALPALLDIPITLPVEEGDAPLGTGPYCYDRDGDALLLRRNTLWWQAQSLPLDTVPLHAVTSADERIAAFDTALISAVTADPTSTNALGYSGSYELWTCPTTNLLYLGFNHASGYCSDVVLRQAISRALDRGVIASTLYSGYADPSALPIAPASPLYDEVLADELVPSVSVASQLLEDGKYKLEDGGRLTRRGKLVELTLLVNSENSFRLATADYIAEELDKLGITVTVSALPWTDYLNALAAGRFDLSLGQIKMTADFDPSVLITGALNYGLFWNEETNALLAAYRAASGEARSTAASAFQAHFASTLPFAPLCFIRTAVYTQWGAVSGLHPTQQNPFDQFHRWTVH